MALLHGRGRWGGRLFALFLCLAFGVVALAFLAERHARIALLTDKGNELRTIVGLKASEIAAWRAERVGDARSTAGDPFLVEAVASWIGQGAQPKGASFLQERAASLRSAYGYERVSLHDPRGKVLLTEPVAPLGQAPRDLVGIPLGEITIIDLHRTEVGESPHLDLVVPLRRAQESAVVACLVLKVDPSTALYPILKSWPVPSDTGETLLVRREGDQVVYLSELRHQTGAPLTLRVPLAGKDLPAARAIKGQEGSFEGVDYRGERVLAAALHVPDSPWFVVSKVDRDELIAPLARERWLIALFALALVSVAAFGVQALWWREHRALDAGLRGSEERYRALAETSHEDIFIVDSGGRLIYLNARAAAKFGDRAPTDLAGQSLATVFPPDLAQAVDAGLKKVRAFGEPVYDECEVELPGYRAWLGLWLAPLEGEGFKGAVMGVARDITDGKRSELSLRAERRLLRTLVDHLPVAIYVKDARLRKTLVNPLDARNLGVASEAEALGRTDFDFYPPEIARALRADDECVLESGQPILNREEVIGRRDGSETWLLTSKVPLHGPDGAVVGLVGFGLDITERKRAEETLLESQRAARLGSYSTDLASGSWMSSEVMDEVFGITSSFRKDVEGWLSLVHPEERQTMKAYLQDEVLGKRQPFDREYRIVRPCDQEERWVHGLGRLVTDPQGKVVALVGTIQDVTDRKRAEAKHIEAEEQLRQSQKLEAIGLLAGGVAHDFNNLLAVITGYGDMVRRQLAVTDPLQRKLEQILKAAGRAAELTSQLLAFGRKQILLPKFIDLNNVVAGVERILQRTIGEHIELKTILEPHLGTVKADPGQVEQILMNLAVNARDAMPEGGQLTIETHNVTLSEGYVAAHAVVKPGAYVLLQVADTGAGMSSETQARIFEPFFTTKEPSKGTGLGLSTVYGIVKQSGGYIWVYSEPHIGTTFKVYLPRVDEEVARALESEALPASGGSETVLLIEDEASLRELLRETLEQAGYSLLVARDGAEALQMGETYEGAIHLVVTDVIMPGIQGPKVAEALVRARPQIKILFVSGYSDDAVLKESVLGPGRGFLGKPFGPESLLRKVREVLDGHARNR